MKVKLLRGPIQKFATIKPAQRLKFMQITLMNNKPDAIMNNGFLPIRSERTPAKKLPMAYEEKVKRVRVSISSVLRNMTPRTINPESQNSKMSNPRKSCFFVTAISFIICSVKRLSLKIKIK